MKRYDEVTVLRKRTGKKKRRNAIKVQHAPAEGGGQIRSGRGEQKREEIEREEKKTVRRKGEAVQVMQGARDGLRRVGRDVSEYSVEYNRRERERERSECQMRQERRRK